MTIRNALLRAFLWLVLATVVVIGGLSFVEGRRALQSEIADNLQSGAAAALQRTDTFFFAQFENMRIWRSLEVMQDIRVNDVDKRLSNFLSELRKGQGNTYQALFCTNTDGQIIASSDVRLIGRKAPDISRWHTVAGADGGDVLIEPAGDRTGHTVALRAPIANAFGKGRLGYLYAMLNWQTVLDLLDDAASGPRSAVLLNARGTVIGASRELRTSVDLAGVNMAGWVDTGGGRASSVHSGRLLGHSTLLVGTAESSGYQHFPGLGWHMLMVEPTSEAYRPVWRMMWSMISVLLLTLAAAAWTSTRLAGRIAEPIVALTEFTRRFRKGEAARPEDPGATSIAEVGELNRAFVDMIEALEQSREQIVRAGKLAVVGEMAAIMAHEVRTPLGILRSSAQLLERAPDLGERERELTGYIVTETDRLNGLVTMLLECARPRPPDFRANDVHDIIDNVLNLLAARLEKKQVSIVRRFTAVDSVLACDREQLTQVFLNLVLNALDFVGAGGRVGIETDSDHYALIVRVFDDGPGIAPENRRLVFDPFFSRREGGIGLGLTIVQQIVQVHHGEIRVTEGPWGGACFEMRFDRRGEKS